MGYSNVNEIPFRNEAAAVAAATRSGMVDDYAVAQRDGAWYITRMVVRDSGHDLATTPAPRGTVPTAADIADTAPKAPRKKDGPTAKQVVAEIMDQNPDADRKQVCTMAEQRGIKYGTANATYIVILRERGLA